MRMSVRAPVRMSIAPSGRTGPAPWPVPWTMTGSPRSRAVRTAAATSLAERGSAIAAGCWSIARFQAVRASSQPGSPGARRGGGAVLTLTAYDPGVDIDWGEGDYERTAVRLAPTAEALVAIAGVEPRHHVLDVGCGTGNASLAAAARGAVVSAIDPSPALVDIARERAAEAGAAVQTIVAEAGSLPFTDRAFDVVLSSFAVIFSPDAAASLREMVRVARPEGVVALSTWLPGGAIQAAAAVLMSLVPAPPEPRPHWDDPDWIAGLLAEAGAPGATIELRSIAFEDESAEAWLAEQEDHHPVWRAFRREAGAEAWDDVRRRTLAALQELNEAPEAFLTTSEYAVIRSVREFGADAG